MNPEFSLDFPYAYGKPSVSGGFRHRAEDFQVDEDLDYQPEGTGEHVYLQIRKRGENTAWVAEHIARLAGVNVNDVGYCGRKDRHAVTTQWFSVYLPKSIEPDWQLLNSDTVNVLFVGRHTHKLRRGEHLQNRFVIRLRDLHVDNLSAFEQRLHTIAKQGVPNYFGEQRFGYGGNNLLHAHQLLVDGKAIRDKQKRGLMISAARSYLFNQVLAERVRRGNWLTALPGEPCPGPSGPLWGRGRLTSGDQTLAIEENVLAAWTPWCHGLEHVGLQQERRILALGARDFSWHWLDTDSKRDLVVSFALDSGEFATAILREAMILRTTDNQVPSED
jgi:tRNA pseudouridine13 synthase